MKWKIWTCTITVVLAVVILRYYVTEESVRSTADITEAGRENTESRAGMPKAGEDTELFADITEAGENAGLPADIIEAGEKVKLLPGMSENGETADTASKKESDEDMIRVLITTDHFQKRVHEMPWITSTDNFYVQQDGKRRKLAAGEFFSLENGDAARLSATGDGRLLIDKLKRAGEEPSYRGTLELTRIPAGIVVINELSLEQYLPAVISSEMSSAFPEEALKAQAVCARTYGRKRMEEKNDTCYGADLDDSVSFQVYNNVLESPETIRAVEDTRDMVLEANGELADIFYYSTSCGVTAGDVFTGEADFKTFIESGRETDPEYQEPWYRWTAVLSNETLAENLAKMGLESPVGISGLKVLEREQNGQAIKLEITGTWDAPGETVIIEGEYDIRRVLAPEEGDITRQDGSSGGLQGLLPSAWFVVEKTKDGFSFRGGGYGHGNGLSQNGARILAEQGRNFEEILQYYYPEMKIVRNGYTEGTAEAVS